MRAVGTTEGWMPASAPAIPEGEVLIVDPSVTLVELLSQHLDGRDLAVEGYWSAGNVMDIAPSRSTRPAGVALVSLDFVGAPGGLDVMVALTRWCPETSLIAYVGDEPEAQALLRVAWEAFGLAGVVSKSSSLSTLTRVIEEVHRCGRAEPDERLGPLLPAGRSPWRSAAAFERLVPHAGHAKLWRALLDSERASPYKDLASRSGLTINTIRNYREDLLPELRLHGLDSPTMKEMHAFAHRARPLLAPWLVQVTLR